MYVVYVNVVCSSLGIKRQLGMSNRVERMLYDDDKQRWMPVRMSSMVRLHNAWSPIIHCMRWDG